MIKLEELMYEFECESLAAPAEHSSPTVPQRAGDSQLFDSPAKTKDFPVPAPTHTVTAVPAVNLGDSGNTMTKLLIARQMNRSGTILLLAMEPLDDHDFYAEHSNGISAAWSIGHLACVCDLFSSWFDGEPLMFDTSFTKIFNDDAIEEKLSSKAASVDPKVYSKKSLLLRLRQAQSKALKALEEFDAALWDAPGPPGTPDMFPSGGTVWELLGVHTYWHLGELAGCMPRYFGTYTLNILPHYFHAAPSLTGAQ